VRNRFVPALWVPRPLWLTSIRHWPWPWRGTRGCRIFVVGLFFQGEPIPAGTPVLLDVYGRNHDPELPRDRIRVVVPEHVRTPAAPSLVSASRSPVSGGS
jgi:hypothetical protein